MHVDFLLGPAGSGKTFRCLAEVRAALLADPEGLPLVFLAPKQATFQLERELLSDPELPGYTRLQILSFDRLAEFILSQFFTAPPRLLSEEGRVMVLRAVLTRHYSNLRIFHASARLPGFARQLSQLLNELQQHQLSPERLIKFSEQDGILPQLRDKLQDSALLLRCYYDWLKENDLEDPNGLLEIAAAKVKQAAQESQLRLGGLWLDGFAEMTPQELALLAALVPSCERVTLAFCLDAKPEQAEEWHSMWASISKTFHQCQQQLQILPGFSSTITVLDREPSKSRFAGQRRLAHLEESWVSAKPFTADEPDTQHAARGTQRPLELESVISELALYTCPNPEIEVVIAAREILRYVREGGGRFRNVAVLVRSFQGYEHVLRRVFTRYNIRFFIDRREPISHHPVAELTRYALRGLVYNWEHDDWFGALKTGLVHREAGRIDEMENLALARGWTGHVWLKPLDLANAPQLERFEKSRQQMAPAFVQLAERLGGGQDHPTGVELAAAIRALWEELGVANTLQQWSEAAAAMTASGREPLAQAEVHVQAWREMEQWLDNLELAFEQTPLPLSNWLGVVESGLANLTAGIIPLALDEVLIGEVERSRNPNLELALVLGLNETVFPAPPPPPALLSPLDRETLASSGLRLGRTQREHIGHERLLGYLACTRARRRLVLTYAQRNGNDQPLNPSPFIDHLQRIFPHLKAEPVAATLDWRQSIHPTELVVPLLQNKVKGANECKIQSLARLEKLTLFAPVLDRWEQLVAAQSVRQLSPGQAEKLYGANLQTSISKLEDYAACPFKFFVGAGLRAEERQQFEADQRERGSFQHEILMEFHRRLQAKGKRWRDFGTAEAREFIGQIGSELQQSFRDGLFVSSAERQFMARTLIEGLQKFIAVLVQWAPQYLFEPQAVEIGFGMEGDSLDPWRIDLGGGHLLLLRGRIDRVDLQPQADNTACAVVIDYKSSGQELTEVKLANGLDLQLLAYLGVLRDAPKAHEVFGVSSLVPAGAFYVSLRSNAPSGKNRTEVLADPDWVRLLGYQHRGRFRADLLEQFDNRHEPRGNQFRYRRNQDGAFSRVGNEVLSEQDFLALVDHIEGFLRRYGQEIYNGDVRVAPYRHKHETACDYCEFRPICRFDPWIEPYRVLKTAGQGSRRR